MILYCCWSFFAFLSFIVLLYHYSGLKGCWTAANMLTPLVVGRYLISGFLSCCLSYLVFVYLFFMYMHQAVSFLVWSILHLLILVFNKLLCIMFVFFSLCWRFLQCHIVAYFYVVWSLCIISLVFIPNNMWF